MLSLIKRLEEIHSAELRNLILELKNIGASDSPSKEEKSIVLSDLFSLFDEHVYFSWSDKYDIILRDMNNEALQRFYNGTIYKPLNVFELKLVPNDGEELKYVCDCDIDATEHNRSCGFNFYNKRLYLNGNRVNLVAKKGEIEYRNIELTAPFLVMYENAYGTKEQITKVTISELGNGLLVLPYKDLFTVEDVLKLFSELQYEMAQQIIGNRGDEKIIPTEWIKTKINS